MYMRVVELHAHVSCVCGCIRYIYMHVATGIGEHLSTVVEVGVHVSTGI